MAAKKRSAADRARAVDEALMALAAKNKWKITADMVIKEAKNPKSPLYGEFNWDEKKAAMAHWRDVARRLIARVEWKFEYRNIPLVTPVFVRDITVAPKQGYITVNKLRTNREIARDTLLAEFERVKAALARAKALAIALDFTDEIEKLESSVTELTGNIVTRLQSMSIDDMPTA